MAESEGNENGKLSPNDYVALGNWLSVPENIAEGGPKYSMIQRKYNKLAVPKGLPAWRIPTGTQVNPTEDMGFFEGVREAFTGTARETDATESALNYKDMPELDRVTKTMIAQAQPQEMASIIKAQNPEVEVAQDVKGNFLLTSGVDGKTYAIKPGLEGEDFQRLATQALIAAPATIATGAVAAATSGLTLPVLAGLGLYGLTSLGYQYVQQAMGGEVDEVDVLVDAVTPPGMTVVAQTAKPILSKIVSNVIQPARQAFSRTFNKYNPPANVVTKPALSDVQLGELFREASDGSVDAQLRLADYAEVDSAVIGAAENLGVGEYLQPDHVSTSVEFIQVVQTLKNLRGTGARAKETEDLTKLVEQSTQAVIDLGAEVDKGVFADTVLSNAEKQLTDIKDGASELWTNFRNAIGEENGFIEVGSGANRKMEPNLAATEYNPGNLLTDLQAKFERLGSNRSFLDPLEMEYIDVFTPREEMREIPQVYKRTGKPQYDSQGKQKVKREPTGELILPNLDQLETFRRKLTRARDNPTLFPTSDKTVLDKLYKNVLEEERTLLEEAFSLNRDESFSSAAILDYFDMARATSRFGFGMQDDLQSVFGKKLDKFFPTKVKEKMGVLRSGDAKQFNEFLEQLPVENRQYTLLNGLNMFLGKNNKAGKLNFRSYVDWWDGLRSQGKSFKLVKDILSEEQFQTFEDVYTVSNSVLRALKEKPIGGATLQKEAIAAITAEKLSTAIVEGAKTLGKTGGTEVVVQGLGGQPGMGALFQGIRTASRQAINRTPTTADSVPRLEAAIDLIKSNDFADMIRGRYSPPSIKKFLNSASAKKYAKRLELPVNVVKRILQQYVSAATSEIITKAVTEDSNTLEGDQASVSAKMLNDLGDNEDILSAPAGNPMTASQQMLLSIPKTVPAAPQTRGVPGLTEPVGTGALPSPVSAPPPQAVAQGPTQSREMMDRLFPMDIA